MSYSYEQQRAYASMEWTWGEFTKMKQDLRQRRCPVHKKLAWAAVEWEKDYDVDVSIYRYCCLDFAEEIKKIFDDKGIFNSVRIDLKPTKKTNYKEK